MDQWLRGSATPACHLGGLRGTESQHFAYGLLVPRTMGVPPPCLCAHVCESMGSRIFPRVHTHEHADVLTYMHMCVHVHTQMGTHTCAHIHRPAHVYTPVLIQGDALVCTHAHTDVDPSCAHTRAHAGMDMSCAHTHEQADADMCSHMDTCTHVQSYGNGDAHVCVHTPVCRAHSPLWRPSRCRGRSQ